MDRIVALLGKELRHHALAGIGLLLILPMAFFLTAVGVVSSPDTVTALTTHQVFLWVFLPLTGLVLGNRLVVLEYHGRTQLFVEALPIRRWEMVTVKYLLGLLIMICVAATSLLLSALIASRTEPISARFLGLMAMRTVAYVYCLWSVLFAMGFLGRFRVPLYVALVVVLFALDALTDLEIRHFGPFAMVDTQLVLERSAPPDASALATTLILATAWTVLAFVLALINEGSVAESLAKRMTLKEKSAIGVIFVAALSATAILKDRREQAPFTFQEQTVLRSTKVPLQILYLHDEALPDAEALQALLESDLDSLRSILSLTKLPPVRVALRESLDASTYEPVGLAKNDGLLLRANFRASRRWDESGLQDFRAFVIHEVLSEVTDGRAGFEPKAWVHDGFSRYWAERDRTTACLESPESCVPLLRALWVTRSGRAVSAAELRFWFRTRERHDEALSEALAFSGLLELERHGGRDRVVQLARTLFSRRAPRDIRSLIYERRNPMGLVFERSAQVTLEDHLDRWNGDLDRLRADPDVASSLATVPDGTARLHFERDEGSIRNLVVRLELERPRPAPSQGDELVVSLLHRDISPFDRPLERHELRREERLVGPDENDVELELYGRYGPGMRVFVALEIESETLGCPVRLLAERREVP